MRAGEGLARCRKRTAYSVSFVLTPHQIITVFWPGSHVLLPTAKPTQPSSTTDRSSAMASPFASGPNPRAGREVQSNVVFFCWP